MRISAKNQIKGKVTSVIHGSSYSQVSVEQTDADGNLTAFSGANVITGQGGSSPTGTPDTSSTGTVNNVEFTSGYSSPEIDHDSGDVLYIENRTPIQRAPDQTENIKLVIEF